MLENILQSLTPLMSAFTRESIAGIVYLSIALLLGKIIILFGPSFPVISDSLKYIEIAQSITQGTYAAIEGIIYPPGYPAVLAFIFSLLGTAPEIVYMVQFLFLAGIALLVFLITYRHLHLPFHLCLVLGGTIIIWPYFLLYSILIMSEVVYTTFLLSAVYLFLNALEQKTARAFAFAGIAIGLTTLIRPITLLLPFWFVGLYILWRLYQKKPWLPTKEMLIGILFFLLTLTPWSLYMHQQTGSLLPVSSHLPHVIDKSVALGYEDSYNEAVTPSLGEIVMSKIKNFFVFWNPGAGGYQAEQVLERFPAASIAITLYKIGFYIILLLAFASLLRPTKTTLFVLWGAILYVWLLHTVLFPYPRYMLPVIPMIIILAGYSLTHYTTQYVKPQWLKK